jgi:DNA helicase II / ATP-dependent DNA helicase PcrA
MPNKIEYEKMLNKNQLLAVTAPDGPILVIAGAGSGKTRTLVYRVAWLVEQNVSPEEILLLTFTRKTAREMLERASDITNDKCRYVSGGTFHSLARQILREKAKYVGFSPSFTIMDRSDMEEAAHALALELAGKKKNLRLPKRSTIANILSKSANMEKPLSDVMEGEYPQFLHVLSEMEYMLEAYQKYKRKNNLMDFDDLLIFLRQLLRDNEETRRILANRYKYIMVDEYQDTNTIQSDIIRYLGSYHKNIMVVGDDSQSIYSFRGANFKNMFDFPTIFPDVKIIKLEENYRSTQPILNMTNALMNQAREKYTKCLFTRKKGDDLPIVVDTATERDQAVYVCRTIETLLDQGCSLKEMAVLFRAGYHSFELELELARRGIPFVKFGGFKFMESAHIKDLLAHLRVILNKEDILSWGRLLRLINNIGPGKSQAIIDWMKETGVSSVRVNEWPGGYKHKEELDKLAKLFGSLCQPDLSPTKAIELVIEYYSPFLVEKFDDYPRRKLELEQLIPMAVRYKNLRSLLDDLSLEPPSNPSDVIPIDKSDYLTLSTVHSAKGLEWGIVFIIWLVDGRFPPGRSFRNSEDIEEELRLLYVATTRAKDKLIMVYPSQEFSYSNGAWNDNCQGGLSSFISALPHDVIDYHSSAPFFGQAEKTLNTGTFTKTLNETSKDPLSFKPGDKITHPAFGPGVIAKFQGEEKVEVIFRDWGVKLLHLGYTTLEKI